jgi:chromosome condensin MukBEF ATPase and DNA-binding subunit MukB
MTGLTLENLAQRLEEVERRLNDMKAPVIAPTKDWRSVVGISQRTDFSERMLAEIEALREADRLAAEAETSS